MKKNTRVYWITGLSGSGKTTLCDHLADHLKKNNNNIIKLDGDLLREAMGASKDHDRTSRLELAMRYSKLCRLLSVQGFQIVISTISLFHEVHEWNRKNLPGYTEIYLDVPMKELMRRDPKKIYKRAREGELKNVAGFDLEVEKPLMPDIVLTYDPAKKPEDVLNDLLVKIQK